MFEKVLIAEDFESTSFSIQKTLEGFGINDPKRVFYCDHALTWIKKALNDKQPYDLLITDLSFDGDISTQIITSGQELIKAVKAIQPSIKVLVFSVEHRAFVVDKLKNELNIDAYVPKGRGDVQDLKLAIETIYAGKKHSSSNLKRLKEEELHKFTSRDIEIIKLLSEGKPQKEIPLLLKEKDKSFGVSSLEKRINFIKTALNISKTIQLIAYCKDRKII